MSIEGGADKKNGSSFSEGSFDEEISFSSPNGTKMSVIPKRCLVTGFKVGEWEVLYRPLTTGNMMRAGLPTMLPCFSSMRGDRTFLETGTIIPHHGFGRTAEWQEGEKRADGVSFYLEDNEETLRIYPFKFKVTVNVSVADNKMTHETVIENRETEKTLPIQPGIHPYFTCPRELMPQIGTQNIEGFNAHDWKWQTKTDTPDNNYAFDKTASFTIPTFGTLKFTEIPQDEKFNYRRMQIWTEPKGAMDDQFICMEPVVWHADGLNDEKTRLNVPPKSTCKIVMQMEATPSPQ